MTTDKTGAPTTVIQRDEEFTIDVDGQTVGIAEFADRGNQRAFIHTEVDRTFAGRGLATILVEEAIKSSKADGLRIVPICSMVAAYLHKHKEFDDVVDPVTDDIKQATHPHGGAVPSSPSIETPGQLSPSHRVCPESVNGQS